MIRHSILAFIILAALLPAIHAKTVVINSDDWMDVYSGIEFAHLNGHDAKFMTGKRYTILLPRIIQKGEKLLILESQRVPYTINLAGTLRRNGYETETLYSTGGRATNLELAKLTNATAFIVIDPSYGYNAIAVIPYALLTKSYVLLADSKNADQIVSFLANKKPESLLLYGQLDENLVERLGELSPEVINKGNRYQDNREIMRKYLSISSASQLLLTDGSVIEEELMTAGNRGEVTLLIGKGATPDEVIQLIKNSHFQTAVLIGTHLAPVARRLKEQTGIPVFMKFGQGVASGTPAEPVKALDMFPLPIINLELVIKKLQYNTITKNVEITFENKGIRAFAKTSAGILANGQRVLTIGDTDNQRIEANETRAFQYPVDLSEYIANKQDLSVDLFTVYGESPDTFDQAISLTVPLPIVTMQDRCEIAVKSVQYNARTQRFMVKVENEGPVTCFVDVELRDVIINDQPVIVETPGVTGIEDGDTMIIEVKQRMTDVDLADNPLVNIRATYGERQEFLLSIFEARLPLSAYSGTIFTTTNLLIAVVALLLLVIILLFFFMMRKRKQK